MSNASVGQRIWGLFEGPLFWGFIGIVLAAAGSIVGAPKILFPCAWAVGTAAIWRAPLSDARRVLVTTVGSLFVALILLLLWWRLPTAEMTPAPLLSSQVAELQEIERMFAGRTESDLREQLGFADMEVINIGLIRDRIIHVRQTGDRQGFSLPPYMKPGDTLQMDTEIIGNHLSHDQVTGEAIILPDFSRVQYIILPAKYSEALKRVQYFESSIVLPSTVVRPLKDLDATMRADARILQHVLDSVLRENENYFMPSTLDKLKYTDLIHNRLAAQFIQLTPKVDMVVESARKYLNVGSLTDSRHSESITVPR